MKKQETQIADPAAQKDRKAIKSPSSSTKKKRLRASVPDIATDPFVAFSLGEAHVFIATPLAAGVIVSTITPSPAPRMTQTVCGLTTPVQYPFMVLPHVVTVHAEYSDHGRNDASPTINVNATATDGSFTVDWGSTVQGGHWVYQRQMPVRHIPSGAVKVYSWAHADKGDIRGQNPDQGAVKTRLGSLEHQVVCFKESRPKWCQFGTDGLPSFGAPNGFGLMQLDNGPTPTAREIWDWQQNLDAGVKKYEDGKGTVRQHYKNVKAIHPNIPDLTDDQLRFAYYQYYNAGNNGFYWIPDSAGASWVKNPNAAYTDYGDEAVRFEDLVKAGTPPPGWN